MKCEIQRSSYLHCIRRYRRLALGFDMSGDMRCHTDGTPSDADTVYRTQISYEYMGSVRIIPHEMEDLLLVVQLLGIAPQEYTFHEIQLVHLDRSILQTHCIILPSPQVHVHKSVRFEKSTWIAFFGTDWVEVSTCWGTCTATLMVLHQTRTLCIGHK